MKYCVDLIMSYLCYSIDLMSSHEVLFSRLDCRHMKYCVDLIVSYEVSHRLDRSYFCYSVDLIVVI